MTPLNELYLFVNRYTESEQFELKLCQTYGFTAWVTSHCSAKC